MSACSFAALEGCAFQCNWRSVTSNLVEAVSGDTPASASDAGIFCDPNPFAAVQYVPHAPPNYHGSARVFNARVVNVCIGDSGHPEPLQEIHEDTVGQRSAVTRYCCFRAINHGTFLLLSFLQGWSW